MSFKVRADVPTEKLDEFMRVMGERGFTVFDTGDRISTEAGICTEATVEIVIFTAEDFEGEPHGVRA